MALYDIFYSKYSFFNNKILKCFYIIINFINVFIINVFINVFINARDK